MWKSSCFCQIAQQFIRAHSIPRAFVCYYWLEPVITTEFSHAFAGKTTFNRFSLPSCQICQLVTAHHCEKPQHQQESSSHSNLATRTKLASPTYLLDASLVRELNAVMPHATCWTQLRTWQKLFLFVSKQCEDNHRKWNVKRWCERATRFQSTCSCVEPELKYWVSWRHEISSKNHWLSNWETEE